MRRYIDIDFSDFVDGAHQFEFLVRGQIPEVENPDFAEGEQGSERAGIFAVVTGRLWRICASGIGMARTGKRLLNDSAVGGEDFHMNPWDWENLAGYCGDVLVFSGR